MNYIIKIIPLRGTNSGRQKTLKENNERRISNLAIAGPSFCYLYLPLFCCLGLPEGYPETSINNLCTTKSIKKKRYYYGE